MREKAQSPGPYGEVHVKRDHKLIVVADAGLLDTSTGAQCTGRVQFIRPFTAGKGTTCGEWTPQISRDGQRGFFKASAATGSCPVRCEYCYLQAVPFQFQSVALNVGEFTRQAKRGERGMPICDVRLWRI